MQSTSLATKCSLACLLAAGLLAIATTPARAAYAVIDDDLYPTSMVEVNHRERVLTSVARLGDYAPPKASTPTPPQPRVEAKVEVKVAPLAQEHMDWELSAADGTLQQTFERWSKVANWQVRWEGVPPIKNMGSAKLLDRGFLDAAEFVLSKVKIAAKAAGLELAITAYPDQVLIISVISMKASQ